MKSCVITSVRLDYNSLDDDSFEILTKAFASLPSLKRLSLAFCDLKACCGYLLSDMMKSSRCKLLELNLEGNWLGDDGVSVLSEGLPKSGSIETLNISNNRFQELETTKKLALACRATSTMKTLDIEGNTINEIGGRLILSLLQELPRLNVNVCTTISNDLFRQIMEASKFNRTSRPKVSPVVITRTRRLLISFIF